MKRIAVVTDSNSGITAAQAMELGIFLVPTSFMIDGTTYYEGIDLSEDDFFGFMEEDKSISTSQASPAETLDMWESILSEYDELVYIPLSSGLSGTCGTAVALSSDFDGRVQVVNNQRISITQKHSVYDALNLIKAGKSAHDIKRILEIDALNSSIYIMVDTLTYLKKGGRITPAAAALGTMLKLKPVLQIKGDKLDAYAKARTVGQAKSIIINAVRHDMENLYGGVSPDLCEIGVAYTHNLPEAEKFKEELQEAFPGFTIKDMDPLSLVVSCHIGPGALAATVTQKLNIQ